MQSPSLADFLLNPTARLAALVDGALAADVVRPMSEMTDMTEPERR
jgi:hypothetical protein